MVWPCQKLSPKGETDFVLKLGLGYSLKKTFQFRFLGKSCNYGFKRALLCEVECNFGNIEMHFKSKQFV